MPQTLIETPCTQVCAVDGRTGWCLGCGRTLAEIGSWSSYTDAERDEVMLELPVRIEQLIDLGKRVSVS